LDFHKIGIYLAFIYPGEIMADKLMPEERLLNIIRSGKKRFPGRGARATSVVEAKLRGLLSAGMVARWLSGAAIAVLATGAFYLAATVLLPVERSTAMPLQALPPSPESEIVEELVKREQPMMFYLEGVRERNIFEMKDVRAKESEAVPVDLFKDLSLQGVIAENPPQAIIKDKRSGNTFFLYTGDKIGDMNVNSISEGKVVVEHKGELYEMHL
jgi:hypothetical protein